MPDEDRPAPAFRVEVADAVATVWFDRPPVNAIDTATLEELVAVFGSFRARDDVHCVLFASANERVFSAGADTKNRGRRRDTPLDLDGGRLMRDALEAVLHCAVPVVAAVNGATLGSGLGLVSCCDVIVASERATFGLPEVDAGLLGGGAHVARMIGPHRMRELFFTARRIPAAELAGYGAVSRVVPHEQLLEEARALAATIAAKDPLVVRTGKEALDRVEGLPLMEAYRIEQDYTARLSARRARDAAGT
jgi:enoyl-CoA hydratase